LGGRGTGEGQGGLKPTLTRTSFSPVKYHQVRRISPTRAPTLIRLLHRCSGQEVSSNGGITAARNGYTVCPWLRYGGDGLRVLESSSNLIVACTLRNYPNVLTLGQPCGPSLREWGIFDGGWLNQQSNGLRAGFSFTPPVQSVRSFNVYRSPTCPQV